MFCWSTKGRLRPMRMVWLDRNDNSPKYELMKYRQPSLRRAPRNLQSWTRVEHDQMRRRDYPRVLDEYGIIRRPKRS